MPLSGFGFSPKSVCVLVYLSMALMYVWDRDVVVVLKNYTIMYSDYYQMWYQGGYNTYITRYKI